VKALFRRGKAYLAQHDLDKAETDLQKASNFAPDDKAIQKELATLKLKEKQQEKKQQKFYSGMFDKIQKEDQTKMEKKEKKEKERAQDGQASSVLQHPDKSEYKSFFCRGWIILGWHPCNEMREETEMALWIQWIEDY